jgi:3alpha(or 20beta)-hydroxysteroid dehydrogenase
MSNAWVGGTESGRTEATGNRLAGKVALITGAAQGQGAAEARRFAREGARVVVADVKYDAARGVAREIGASAMVAPLDVTDPEQWDRAVRATVQAFGGLDILVNNAGIAVPPTLLDEIALEDHHRILAVNLDGVLLGTRAVVAAMRERGGGAIVNISSIDGIVGVAGMASYTASKFAVTGLTRTAALELGRFGIRVNSIHPGVIASPMVDKAPAEVRARLDRLLALQPIPRMGTPDEVANLALFLASDESSYCTGAQFVIDGGHLAGPYREGLWEAGPSA